MRTGILAVLGWGLGLGAALGQDLSANDRQRIADDPGAFLDAAATATAWFGDPRGLNAQAVEDFVAAERAARRADVLALLLQADLSADGAVSGDEVTRLGPSLSPHQRGRLIAAQDRADGDGNGLASAAEIAAFAKAEALRLFPDAKARDLKLILLFDRNADGWVSYDEVADVLKDLAA